MKSSREDLDRGQDLLRGDVIEDVADDLVGHQFKGSHRTRAAVEGSPKMEYTPAFSHHLRELSAKATSRALGKCRISVECVVRQMLGVVGSGLLSNAGMDCEGIDKGMRFGRRQLTGI